MLQHSTCPLRRGEGGRALSVKKVSKSLIHRWHQQMAQFQRKLTCSILRCLTTTYPKLSLPRPKAQEEFGFQGRKMLLLYIQSNSPQCCQNPFSSAEVLLQTLRQTAFLLVVSMAATSLLLWKMNYSTVQCRDPRIEREYIEQRENMVIYVAHALRGVGERALSVKKV